VIQGKLQEMGHVFLVPVKEIRDLEKEFASGRARKFVLFSRRK